MQLKRCETSWKNLRQPNLRRNSKNIFQPPTNKYSEKQPRTNKNNLKTCTTWITAANLALPNTSENKLTTWTIQHNLKQHEQSKNIRTQQYNGNILKLASTSYNYQKTTQPNLSTLNSRLMFSTWYNLKQAGQPKSKCNHQNNLNNQTIWKIENYLKPNPKQFETMYKNLKQWRTASEEPLTTPYCQKQLKQTAQPSTILQLA